MNVCFLKFYKTCFLFLFIASLFSCTEVITEQETVQNVTQNTYCEVSFSLNGNGDSSSRAAELKQLVKDELYYTVDVIKENGTTEKTYPESGAWTYSELYKAKLRLSAGKWKFTLKAYNDDKKSILVLISGQTSMEIKAGTNRIKFEMKEPVDGIGDFTMKMTLGSDVNEVTAKLCHLDGTDVTTEELGSIWSESDGKIEQSWLKTDFTTSDDGKTSYVEYNIKNIKKGYYMVCWKFSKENENEPQTFNSLATVVTGCTNSDSYDVREDANKNPDVVSYYSVFYDLNVEDESLVKLPDGITLKDTKLYKEGDDVKIITFELVREGYIFDGWKVSETLIYHCPENTENPVTFVMPSENIKLIAVWVSDTSTEYKVCHWQQKLNDEKKAVLTDYELMDTKIGHGETEKITNATAEIYPGFTARAITQQTIKADGNTVVNVYYDRNENTIYKVKHHLQELKPDGTDVMGSSHETDYKLDSDNIEEKSGITGTWSAASGKSSYSGFKVQNITQQEINGNGTTVVDVYYDRISYKLSYSDGVGENIKVEDDKNYYFETKVTAASKADRTGYYFEGWKRSDTGVILVAGADFTMPAGNLTLTAQWTEKSNTAYKVRYWKQKLNDEKTDVLGTDKTITEPTSAGENAICQHYEFAGTESLTGTTKAKTQAKTTPSSINIDFTGFSTDFDTINNQKEIAADGSTIVDIFYNRICYAVSYDGGVVGETITVSPSKDWYYGSTVTVAQASTRQGYTMANWNRSDINEAVMAGGTFEMPAENLVLTATWTANTNTIYTVKHYLQNLDEVGKDTTTDYTEDETARETKTGTTLSDTKAEAKTYTGFTAQNIVQQTIKADVSTVVNIYYNRNSNTAYTVRHHLQDLNDEETAAKGTTPESDYSPDSENTRTGITGAWTSASAKTYTGYTKQAFEQQAIAADGSTVIDIYYNRNNYAVEYNDGVENETITVPETKDWCYGSKVTVATDIPTRTGYTFLGWTTSTTDTSAATYSAGDKFKMEAKSVTLYARWTKNALPGGNITITKNEYSDMVIFDYELTRTNKNVLTFTGANGYSSYTWWIGNSESAVSTEKTYNWDTSTVLAGTYDVTLIATDSNGSPRSQTMTIVIGK